MEKILVTGCLGQLGKAVVEELEEDYRIFRTDIARQNQDAPDYAYLDITDAKSVIRYVSEYYINIIINCAAFTNVDLCEKEYDLAYRLNALGPRNLAIAANSAGAKFVHISTDYVFTGLGKKPLSDEIQFFPHIPVNAYGRTKLAGEQYVEKFCNEYFILRTSGLYGEGKNFVQAMLELAETHDEVSVVDDQICTPTSTDELARVIHELIETNCYRIYHATCEGETSWADFASEIFKKMNLGTKVRKITTCEYEKDHPDSAERPRYSVLSNTMLRLNGFQPMKDWKDALNKYLEELKIRI